MNRTPGVEEELRLYLASGYPLLYLLTHEEERALKLVAAAARGLGRKMRLWSFGSAGEERGAAAVKLLRSLGQGEPEVVALPDFHALLGLAEVWRCLREICPRLSAGGHTLVVIAPQLVIPAELEKDITVLELELPDYQHLMGVLRAVCAREKVLFPEDFLDRAVRAALGLSENEAQRAFTRALRQGGGFKLNDISLILEEKKKAIRKSEVLEYFELEEDLESVGGLEEVKEWVRNRARAFTPEAARYGLPAPKGLLLIGVQGCGKSLTAKAVAGAWKLPLVRLDLGAVFGSPSPESAMHAALRLAQALAPVVLWVDEIEKGFSGAESSRVFGTFITWLQEKRAPVFVVATANEVQDLPPELLRKGRFDETFFVDLPDVHERAAILAVHLKRRGRQPQDFDLAALARQSEHYSGAELEQAILAGMFRAFGEGREVTTSDISRELDAIVPLYSTYEEKIKALREWARNRARRASIDQRLVDLFSRE
jgi:AAA+ superfamily predicted ATPase